MNQIILFLCCKILWNIGCNRLKLIMTDLRQNLYMVDGVQPTSAALQCCTASSESNQYIQCIACCPPWFCASTAFETSLLLHPWESQIKSTAWSFMLALQQEQSLFKLPPPLLFSLATGRWPNKLSIFCVLHYSGCLWVGPWRQH